MVSLIGGLIAAIVGVIFLVSWWGHFLNLLMGALPILLLIGGGIAIFGGYTSIKDKLEAKEEESKAKDKELEELKKEKGKKEKK